MATPAATHSDALRSHSPSWGSRRPRVVGGQGGRGAKRHLVSFFFFNDAATPEIYPLPLPAAFPISSRLRWSRRSPRPTLPSPTPSAFPHRSTRSEEHTSELQSRFGISYAVFCL